MKFFKVDLIDERGRHTVETLAVEHVDDLYAAVKDRGLYLAGSTEVTRLGGTRIPTLDLIIFTRQLSTMIEAGVSILDASCGGLGGCPFAPDATGNIGTEDLVYMLERAGFSTSYDLSALISTATWMAEILGKPPAAAVSRAGVFPF